MAKTLCRVAGGGKPLKGNAEAGDVLAGKTFSNKQSNALTGTMPNNGALNITLTPSGNNSTSQAVAAGYYSGGTITANGSSSYNSGYTNGHNQGVTDGINSVNIDFFCAWAFESNSSNWQGHGGSVRNTLNKNTGNIIYIGPFNWYNSGSGNARHVALVAKVNCTIVSNRGTWNLNAGQNVDVQLCGGSNDSGDVHGYAYAR